MVKAIVLAGILTVTTTMSYSHQRTITGTVKDFYTKEGVPFCTILQGTAGNGVLTDEKGNFKISFFVNEKNEFLLKSVGYDPYTLQILVDTDSYLIYLKPDTTTLEEIVITGTTRASLIRENPISITAVSSRQMERTVESNIIDALVKNVPGLKSVKTGPNISKPFIRGLGYNRVLTLYDGIRQEGQQYGDEHGIEIDNYNIERVEVIKGPASLLYGSDAIAGVISLFPFIPMKEDEKLHGKIVNEYQANNNLIGTGLRLDYSDEYSFFVVHGSHRMAKNYRNPVDGRVYLTGFNEKTVGATAGIKEKYGYTNISFNAYDNQQGIPDGSRDSVSRRFTRQILDEEDDIRKRPVVSDKELNRYKIPDLAQRIQHYRAYVHSYYDVGMGNIDVLLGAQQNVRREFSHPEIPSQAGMYIRLNTVNYGVRYNAPKIAAIDASIGINGMWQDNKNKDATDFPVPDYTVYDGGMYLYGKWKEKQWSISGGIRYDIRHVRWADFYVGENPETGFGMRSNSSDPHAELPFEAFAKTYYGMSGSLGVTVQVSEDISMKANIGRAYRAPHVTETGSNGLDPGAHIIYLGDRSFLPEFSLQGDVGMSLKRNDLSADVSLFHNSIENFIYMASLADERGELILDAQGNRTFQYQQSKARLYGGEFWLAIHPSNWNGFRMDNSMSMVYGFNRKPGLKGTGTKGEYLPLIPPAILTSSVSQKIETGIHWLLPIIPKMEVEYTATQNRYLGTNKTETKTDAYTLFHAGLTTGFDFAKDKPVEIVFQLNNLLNKAYQSHLNRLKYFEHYEHSTNGRYGIYNMGRNLVIKAIVKF